MRHKIRLRKSNERGYKQTKEIGGVSVSKASKTFLKFSPIARRFTALIVKQLSKNPGEIVIVANILSYRMSLCMHAQT